MFKIHLPLPNVYFFFKCKFAVTMSEIIFPVSFITWPVSPSAVSDAISHIIDKWPIITLSRHYHALLIVIIHLIRTQLWEIRHSSITQTHTMNQIRILLHLISKHKILRLKSKIIRTILSIETVRVSSLWVKLVLFPRIRCLNLWFRTTILFWRQNNRRCKLPRMWCWSSRRCT